MSFVGLTDSLAAVKAVSQVAGQVADRTRHVSLPSFVRPSLIESPNFMQASLAEEPVVNDILKNLYNIYVGYILCALQMNDLVVGNRRVRDILETVSTAGAFESFIDTKSLVTGLQGSIETVRPVVYNKKGEVVDNPDDYETKPHPTQWGSLIVAYDASGRPIRKSTPPQATHNTRAVTSPDKAHNIPIASGRQIELTFSTGPDSDPITLTINVKFNTRLVPDSVMEFILSQDFTNDIYRRWLQYRAGEIRFLKDFVLGVDKVNRKLDAVKKDTTGVLTDMFAHKNKNVFKRILSVVGKGPTSHNLANSILMIDEATAARETKKIGFSFDRLSDRKRFFDNTYNLFIVLVDNRYSRVTIYTNGIDQSASYSFNDLKASAATDKMSMKEIVDYLSRSQMPKF